jgi:uncharacterized protein (TIGR03435 family)
MRTIGKVLVLAMAVNGIAALSVAQTAQKPAFEVVSIKPITSSNPFGTRPISITGGRFVANDNTLRSLASWAYRSSDGKPLLRSQIVGLPAWAETDRFDFQAKPEGESRDVPLEEMRSLVRGMLEDRFQLKAHRELRELPIYNLVVAKSGKLKLSQDQTPVDPAAPKTPSPSGPARGSFRNLGKPSPTALTLVLSGTAVRVDEFMGMLGQYADRPLIDKTGLSGLYDFELQFDMAYPATNGPTRASEPGMSSLFTDLQDQLGLKLESAKVQLEVLVIDSVQRPREN